jgi:hypothetical protein
MNKPFIGVTAVTLLMGFLLSCGVPDLASAGVDVGVSINIGPPPIVVAEPPEVVLVPVPRSILCRAWNLTSSSTTASGGAPAETDGTVPGPTAAPGTSWSAASFPGRCSGFPGTTVPSMAGSVTSPTANGKGNGLATTGAKAGNGGTSGSRFIVIRKKSLAGEGGFESRPLLSPS